jgi:uncharacterized membrane protein
MEGGKVEQKTWLNVDENIAGLLCYIGIWVTGIIFLLMEKENESVKFHAMQSIVTFLPLMVIAIVIGWIPWVGWILAPLVWLLTVILWLVLMIKAYQGEKFKLPIVGDIAEKQAVKV